MNKCVDIFSNEFLNTIQSKKELEEIVKHFSTCDTCKEKYGDLLTLFDSNYQERHYNTLELKKAAKQDWLLQNKKIDGTKLSQDVRESRKQRCKHLSECQECSILYWEKFEEVKKE